MCHSSCYKAHSEYKIKEYTFLSWKKGPWQWHEEWQETWCLFLIIYGSVNTISGYLMRSQRLMAKAFAWMKRWSVTDGKKYADPNAERMRSIINYHKWADLHEVVEHQQKNQQTYRIAMLWLVNIKIAKQSNWLKLQPRFLCCLYRYSLFPGKQAKQMKNNVQRWERFLPFVTWHKSNVCLRKTQTWVSARSFNGLIF